nr:DHH family phosphoesterase [Spirochaetaceae bacterium]
MDIYITGHKNPDLDSICAAVTYADLKGHLDPKNNYIPMRCGTMNAAARELFKDLEMEPPRL